MAHHHHDLGFNVSASKQTFEASVRFILTFMGGVLVLSSFIAERLFSDAPVRLGGGLTSIPQSDLMALIGAVFLGFPLVWHAVVHLAAGEMHMDELVALAIVAAIALGEYQEAGIIAFFMIISTLIETRTALGARASIESLLKLTPQQAHVVNPDGSESMAEARVLRPGQVIRVRPGDNVPADGEVIRGESSINQANITGESLAVDKTVGDEVFSGTTNLTGALDIRVTKAGQDTTLGRVQQLILEAERTRIPLMRLIDRYSSWYTPTILMLAAIVLFFSTDKHEGMRRAITMLIVACPCALVLATPTAVVAALSCASRLGVLIKNVVNLEYARSLTAIVFDKTGTLTTGVLSVTQMKPAPGVDGAELLKAAASAEQLSKHPTARALVEIARKARLLLSSPEQFEETAGRGVSARIDGEQVMVGRSKWLEEHGADMSLLKLPGFEEVEGLSMLYVVKNKRCIGWIGLEDKTRPEARHAIDELRELGIRNLTMVTGDKWSVANRVAAEMGCSEVQAECLPAEKLDLVNELKQRGHTVAVIGDGVNDAPALAAGHLGIAMGAAGSDVAINSASIALLNNDLARLPFLVRLSRATWSVIRQNLVFGVAFIIITEALAMWGKLSPIAGAMLHTVATAVVIFNSARLVPFGAELRSHESLIKPAPERPHESMPVTAQPATA